MVLVPHLDCFTVVESHLSATGARLKLKLPAKSPYFDGHFPGNAILPGVAQLAIALHAVQLIEGGELTLVGLRQVKFRRPLRPETECELVITRTDSLNELRFEVFVAGGTAASGTLEVARREGFAG